MASIKEIADEVGVSIATVSVVLSGKADKFRIAEGTRAKIRDAAERVQYCPNLTARGLRTGRTYVLGLLFNSPLELIYAELLSHFHVQMHEHGYAGICAFWKTLSDAPDAFRSVLDRGVDGLITSHDDLTLIPNDVPAVLLFQRDGFHDSVNRDSGSAMRLAVHHLLDLGHRRLGVLNLARLTYEPLLRNALDQRGLQLEVRWISDSDSDYLEGTRRCMARIMALPPETRPTALICRNDTAAMVTISEAGRRGIHVPHDLSVIGFDAVRMGEIANPPLTTVGVTPAELARQSAALMIRRLETPDADCHEVVLAPELIERTSCGPPSEGTVSGTRNRN